jgi:hypothetical protein
MSKEIKDRIDRILAQHDAAKESADREHARSAIGQAQTNITSLQRFLWQFAQGLAWIWRTIGRPVAAVVIAVAGWLFGWYVRLWGRLVTVTNQYGDRVFSYKRAGVMVLATVFGLLFASVLAQLTWDAGWYAYNGGWEQVYLRSPQELAGHPGEDVHAVRGCEHGPSCTELDALYYRVRFKPFNLLWSLWTHGSVFYPDLVAAAVPTETSLCRAHTYGIRVRFITRHLNWHPDLLSVKCVPLERAPQ